MSTFITYYYYLLVLYIITNPEMFHFAVCSITYSYLLGYSYQIVEIEIPDLYVLRF